MKRLSLRFLKANAQKVHMDALKKTVLTPAFVRIIVAGKSVRYMRPLLNVSHLSTVNGHGTTRKVIGLHNPGMV